MGVRIGIDGAQSTGKTTLFELLKRDFGHLLVFIPEASRIVAPSHGIQTQSDWQALLCEPKRLEAFFNDEERWLDNKEAAGSFLVDSSFFLICAYRRFFGMNPDPQRATARQYDLILYCGIEGNAEEDGFRFLAGREEVDTIYRRLMLDNYAGRFEILPSGEARVEVARRLMRSVLSSKG